jgi:uncharacterized damage-inducible protein DinB
MRRLFAGSTLLAALAAGLLAAPGALGAAEPAKPAAATLPPGVRGDILWQLREGHKKLLSLAEATPAEKFAWRPAEGVRSVGEVYEHVAGGDYLLSSMWGAKPPAGVNPEGLEKNGADKAKVIADLKTAYDHMERQISEMTDKDLDRQVDFFGRKATVRQVALGSAVHAHEHLGQAIAYARMNGITPPWSQPEPKASK